MNKSVKAKYAGIPCYFNLETSEIIGRNVFYDILIDIILWIDVNIACVDCFEIDIEE